jgi:hypothetical protein
MRPAELVDRLNGQSAAHLKSDQQATAVDEETLLK